MYNINMIEIYSYIIRHYDFSHIKLNQKGIWQSTERVIPEAHPLYCSPTPFLSHSSEHLLIQANDTRSALLLISIRYGFIHRLTPRFLK